MPCCPSQEADKVKKVMLPSGLQQKHPRSLPVSRPASDSHASSSPARGGRISGSSVEQQSQHSAEKDRLLNGNRNSSLLSSVSSQKGGSSHCQATTPGGRSLSMKRQRDSSTDGKKVDKRQCREEGSLSPPSANVRSSTSTLICSPPKYVKPAMFKTVSETGSVIIVDRCGDKTNSLPNRARPLFTKSSAKPKLASCNSPLVTGPSKLFGKDFVKEEIKSCESKCKVDHFHTPDTFPLLLQKCSDERSPPTSSHTSSLPGRMHEVKISSPPLHSELITFKGKIKLPKQDPDASLPSTSIRCDVEENSLDLELIDVDLGLESCALSLSSSDSSEEDQLLPLQEILERSAKAPDTPEKGAFSEPRTPVPKAVPEDVKNKITHYKNTLEQMLKEKEQNQKTKEIEMQLLQSCNEDLLKLDEDIEVAEAALSHEQREFLQKFSVTSCVIRDLHPGEEVFTLANFGRLFDHQSLDLRKLCVTPNTVAQRTLLQAHSEHVLLLLSTGLFRRAYCTSPCQPQVTHYLFQMMSVHPNPSICAQILCTMKTIALSAAQHIVDNSSKKFKVWVPSLKDIALVFLNMGVSLVKLFPQEALQPPFTEGDLLESFEIRPDDTRSEKERSLFPEHNFESIVKYLALCAALCPKAYTDEELLLLLALIGRVSLETSLQLMPTGELSCLLQHLLSNMMSWEIQLPQVCQVITDLTEDHHNLRWLVQLLPYSVRGKQLRRHLSVSVISKLLNDCTYKPSCTEFQLSSLRSYLPRMRPSTLLKSFIVAQREQQDADDCAPTPDQQAYYLCYSLLALMNEASNFEYIPSNQREELLLLSTELEKHIKCDIRENEKMLYRSKVKDFVARIYTRWQVLLLRSRPKEGKLFDYWKPLPEDEVLSNEERHSPEHSYQEASDSSQSEDSYREQEEWQEDNDEVSIKSEEEQEGGVGETLEKSRELHSGLDDTKVKEQVIKVDDKDEKKEEEEEKCNMPVNEEPQGAGSPEELMENDEDEELAQREEELLKDDESLEEDGHLVKGEYNELEELELLDEALLE